MDREEAELRRRAVCGRDGRCCYRWVWGLLAILIAGGAHAEVVRSPPQFDAKVAIAVIDNVGQAGFGRDIIDDNFLELDAGAGYMLTLLDGRMDVTGRVFLSGEHFDRVGGLGNWGGGAELGFEVRLTRSALPPFLRVGARAEGEDYDFKQRDSTIYTGDLELGVNLGPRVLVSVGGEYSDRNSRSDVFDLSEWSAFVGGGYEISPAWRLDGRFTYSDGDVWSTIRTVLPNGQPVTDIFNLIAASEVIQRDDAFNDDFDGLWFVYRLPAKTQEYSLAVTRSFGERASLSLEWLEIRVEAKRDNDYDNRRFQLSLDLKF